MVAKRVYYIYKISSYFDHNMQKTTRHENLCISVGHPDLFLSLIFREAFFLKSTIQNRAPFRPFCFVVNFKK